MMLGEIIDPQRDETDISKEQGTFATFSGILQSKRTTRGWELWVQWKYFSTDWVGLNYFKESHPVDLAQYVVVIKI